MRLNLAVLAVLSFVAAHAEIIDSAAGGFTVKTTLTIKASPDDVYRRLVHNVGDWWDPVHTFSGDSHNLRIEEHPGGCFCEKLPNNGFVHNLSVVHLVPGKLIILSGALGPMLTLAATGSMQIQLTAAEGSTKLEVTYSVGGYLPKGMNTWAAPVDMVLAQQFTRLKTYIETGNPAAPASK